MKNSMKVWLALAAFGVSSNAFALPFIGVGVVGGANYNISTSPEVVGQSVSGGLGYSAGLSAELGPIAAMALYTQLNSKTVVGVTETSFSSKSLQIPVHFTMGLAGSHIGIGGFFETPMEDAGESSYGLSAGAKVSLPFVGVNVRGLVNYGLKDNAGAKSAMAAVLLGWDFL